VGHAQLGRLVQQSTAAGADRQHPTGGGRGQLLFANPRVRHVGVTQANEPPGKPGRFSSGAPMARGTVDKLARCTGRRYRFQSCSIKSATGTLSLPLDLSEWSRHC